MKESSLENADFKKISLAQIKALFEVAENSRGHDISYVKERYLRSSRYFDETLLFMSCLKMIDIQDGEVRLTVPSETGVEITLLEALFRKANKIQVLADYMENFSSEHDTYTFKPSVQKNLQTSGIRNLLLELDFLTYVPSVGSYSISKKGIPYLQSFFRRTSAEQLEKILRQRDKLGLQAELCILAYERKQLKKFPALAKNIKHVSRFDVGAGYDIQSYVPNANGTPELKYIEVKAVSGNGFDFFWSSNEVETSKTYGTQYHLYLLPVSKGGKFDIKNLKIISDPYAEIYTNKKHDLSCVLFHVFPGPTQIPEDCA